MADVREFETRGYRFIKAVFQYSGGVAALPGFSIRRIRFAELLPLTFGFQIIEQILKTAGCPLTALCGCKLRSPAQFSEDGFRSFNRISETLEHWSCTRSNEFSSRGVARQGTNGSEDIP
jgi:hypothetical protein